MEQDTLYLSFSEIPDASEILFKGEIPGIFVEEAIRSHSFSMVTRHFHESLELYFLIEGERFYFVEQDTYHLQEHMATLVDQNQIHKTCPAVQEKSTTVFCAVRRTCIRPASPGPVWICKSGRIWKCLSWYYKIFCGSMGSDSFPSDTDQGTIYTYLIPDNSWQ